MVQALMFATQALLHSADALAANGELARLGRLGLAGTAVAVSMVVPLSMPLLVGGLYVLVRDSVTVQARVRGLRRRCPRLSARVLAGGVGLERWLRRRGLGGLPPLTAELDRLTCPTAGR